MSYKTVSLVVRVLSICPGWFVSECLHRYAPDCWAPAWGKSQCLDVIEDILLSR